MKKRNTAVTILALLVVALLAGCGGSQYQKQLDLGYKYLQEEKYAEAIVAMNKAIDIDDKRPEAYIGLGSVFVSRCDENTVADVSEALKKGYEKSKSEQIVQAFLDLADQLTEKGKPDWAVQLLDFGYKLIKDEKLVKKSEELSQSEHEKTLKQLIPLCEAKEYQKIAKTMNSDGFKKEMAEVTDTTPVFTITKSSTDPMSGTGIGVYADKEGKGRYVYFGDIDNGKRSGDGIWITNFGNRYCVYEGAWNNDMPNGNGVIKSETTYVDEADIEKEMLSAVSGNLNNGLWNGGVSRYDTFSNGDQDGYGFNFSEGRIKVIGKLESDDGFDNEVGKGLINQDNSFVMNLEQISQTYGVSGFSDSIL